MESRQARGRGPAAILAIGTANPPNIFYQSDYPDFYFSVTKSEHLTHLKDKFKRMCKFHLGFAWCCCAATVSMLLTLMS